MAVVIKKKPPASPWAPAIALTRSTILTPAQINAQARTRALGMEQGVLAAQKAVSDQEIARFNNQASRSRGFAAALAKLQSGEDDDAAAQYTNAANTLSGLGTGLSGAVGESYQGAADRVREQVAQLTGGLGNVTAPAAGDITNASQYAGVTIPASSLAESSVNAAALARADAARRVAGISDLGRGYSAQAEDAISRAASDARAVVAQRPGTIRELIAQLTENRSAGVTSLNNLLGQQLTYRQAQAKFAADQAQRRIENIDKDADRAITKGYLLSQQGRDYSAMTGLIPGTNIPTIGTQQQDFENQTDRQTRAAAWTRANGFISDWQGNAVLKNGKKQSVKTTKAGTQPGQGGLTASGWKGQVLSTQKTIREGLKTAKAGKLYQPDDDNADDDGFIDDPNKPGKQAVLYDDALSNAIAGGPNTPRWRAKAKQLVDAAYAPGQSGRPWTKETARKTALATAKLAYEQGTAMDALRTLMEAANLPAGQIEQAIRKVYFAPARSPINGIPPTSPDYPGYKE